VRLHREAAEDGRRGVVEDRALEAVEEARQNEVSVAFLNSPVFLLMEIAIRVFVKPMITSPASFLKS
jgi:hypothetical protein